ncbi:hypothetical protein KR044_004074, partial [Drosophila immigrans]
AHVFVTAPPTQVTLQCDPGHHIVVKSGILFLNNGQMVNEKARYPPKMECDLELKCDFKFALEKYGYIGQDVQKVTQLTIKYDCKKDEFQGNPRRITDYGRTGGCPQDSFVQKHVAYFDDANIAPTPDNPAAQRERELIAMSVSAQIRRFREANPGALLDPLHGTVYMIYNERSGKNDFMLSTERKDKCRLKYKHPKIFKYKCMRDDYKWTCTSQKMGRDVAEHDKNNSHLT